MSPDCSIDAPRLSTAPYCPTCGRPLFDLDASVLLDWLQRLQTDLDNLKYAIEEALP